MKKTLTLLLCLVLLLTAGCAAAPAETTEPAPSVPEFTGQTPEPDETLSPELFGGIFELNLNGQTVTITMPDAFIGEALDQACVGGSSNDMLSYLTYTLSDASVEDLRMSIEEEAFYARENGWYKSHGESESIDGFTTMYLVYDDSVYSYYAWKELDGVTLFLCAELEDMELELSDLIASVRILEN